MSGQNARPMFPGIQHIGGGQAERIDGAIRDFHCANKRRVDRRFQLPCPRRIHGLRLNTCCVTGGDKGFLKGEVIFGKGDKEAIGRFNAVAGDTLEDLVFRNTFPCRLTVSDGVSRAAVEQTVVSPGRARGNIVAFQKRDA